MKRFLVMMLAMTMMGTTAYASEVKGFAKAKPVEQKIELDDYNVEMKGYNINGYNYMRLRDVAKAMTDKANVDDYNFDVIYNQETNSVYLETGSDYKETEDGKKFRIHPAIKDAVRSEATVYLNGVELTDAIEGYVIDGYTYYKLRDLGKVIGFQVNWLESSQKVRIETRNTPR